MAENRQRGTRDANTLRRMTLTDDVCYRAVIASDARFDGVFFVGVSSTGIYCRPICPARKPRRDRCSFFATAAAAEREGFRPCLRCRPERSPGPGHPGDRDGTAAAIVARIREGALNDGAGLDDLAAEFGLSTRQVRRIVRDETGASPVELAQTCRLLLARQLLAETSLPITRVAFAAGFSSLRRFHQSVRDAYHTAPGDLRRGRGRAGRSAAATISLRLAYRPPLDWPGLLAFLAPRAIRGVEEVRGETYRRVAAFGDHRGVVAVRPAIGNTLQVEVSEGLVGALPTVLERLRELFDLGARPDVIDGHLGACPRLSDRVRRRPGLRVPGAFEGFELAWRAVLGQQVSVAAATTLAGRFAEAFGEPVDDPEGRLRRATPTAARVAAAGPARIATVGLTRARAHSVHALATRLVEEPSLLTAGRAAPEVTARLTALPGIGPWTAAYVAMRALRWPDAFPESDLGIRAALGERSPARARSIADAWRPWRAYAAMHLWTSLADGSRT